MFIWIFRKIFYCFNKKEKYIEEYKDEMDDLDEIEEDILVKNE